MSGFLGVLDPPAAAWHLEELVRDGGHPTTVARCDIASGSPLHALEWDARTRPTACASRETSQRVASVVSKVQALTELIRAKTKNRNGEQEG